MKQLFLVLLLIGSLAIHAQQQLVFTNADSSKSITISQNDLVRLGYTGYFNQPQETGGRVSAITDTTITVSPRKKLFRRAQPAQTIYLRHITGFRRYSKFRPAGEIMYGVAAMGIAGTVTAVIAQADIPTALGFLSAAGTSIVTGLIGKTLMSDRIKNRLADGWTMRRVVQATGQ